MHQNCFVECCFKVVFWLQVLWIISLVSANVMDWLDWFLNSFQFFGIISYQWKLWVWLFLASLKIYHFGYYLLMLLILLVAGKKFLISYIRVPFKWSKLSFGEFFSCIIWYNICLIQIFFHLIVVKTSSQRSKTKWLRFNNIEIPATARVSFCNLSKRHSFADICVARCCLPTTKKTAILIVI